MVRAGEHEHPSEAVFVGVERSRWHEPASGLPVEHVEGDVARGVGRHADFGYHQLAGVAGRRELEQTLLEGAERDREVRFDRVAGDGAGVGVDAARLVDGDHPQG